MTPVFVLMVIFSFVLLIVKMAMDHEKEKLRLKGGQTDKSMTTSELQRLIEEAVSRASIPLNDRIEALENRLDEVDQAVIRQGNQHLLLDEPGAGSLEDETRLPSRHRAR